MCPSVALCPGDRDLDREGGGVIPSTVWASGPGKDLTTAAKVDWVAVSRRSVM